MSTKFAFLALLLAAVATLGGEAARILAIFPSSSPSQVNVYTALTKQLAREGHQITVLSPFPQKWAPPGYTDFDLMHGPVSEFKNKLAMEGSVLYSTDWKEFYKTAMYLWRVGVELTEAVMTSPQVKDIMSNPNGFDLVIAEYFLHEALYGLAPYYKVPLVLFAPSDLVLTDPSPLSFVPHPLLSLNSPMTFTDRLINALANTFWAVGYNFFYLPKQETINKQIFGDDAPSVWDIEPAIILHNSHPVLSQPLPLMPNAIEVGGLHIQSKLRDLPEDMQEFIDDAENGVIYFSFGGSLKCSEMPPVFKNAFLEAFEELDQNVIWVYDGETLPGKPENVFISKWVPQQEILAHPKTVAMITHGGIVSGQEAAHFGVPVVAVPVFNEQQLRAEKTHRDGYGVILGLRNVTKNSLLWAINEAVSNPRIKQATEQRALLLRDQAQPPLERAVFWVEYVLRHKGARHLQSAGRRLSWWQRHSLDVIGVLITTLLLLPLSLCAVRRGK
ncbi:UDP-glycosyltransferase UGT5-like [Neocloeon triangulifer]|uniref:UDP-glycosyltransferase UGT5-like n=1 Tax=Neocloeon triangulifer TaxID=2078957 RepID=UPI00286F660E|nr:UDP-glycosyltransferase UGT5-like [Neocloeon triangulifer]